MLADLARRCDASRACRAACRRLLPPGPVVLAVSGGADSLALLELMVAVHPGPLVVWHLDHGLRPGSDVEGIAVQRRVRQLARRCRRVSFVGERCDLRATAAERGIGLEQAGRDERYARLVACARAHGATAVCTAHHRDDLVETAVMNLLRGSGLTGLAAIPEVRELAPGIALVRPLLRVPPARLRGLLRRRSLGWSEDPTNRDPRHTRNRVRHWLLPMLREADLDRPLAARCFAAQVRLRQLDAAVDAVWSVGDDSLAVAPLLALDAATRSHAWRRLVRWLDLPASRATIARLEDLAQGAPGRRLDLGGVALWHAGGRLRWEAAAEPAPPPALRHEPATGRGDDRLPVIDPAAVSGELELRHARPGERWRPLGAPGSRPVLRFLADRGVPARARRQLWLVADASGVVWIPGHAIADRVRLAPGRPGLRLSLRA